jgi:hypothetical protein
MDCTENAISLLLFTIVAMQTYLFAKPLLGNGCCILAYLAVVAQQWVYMARYVCMDMNIIMHVPTRMHTDFARPL